MVASAAAAPQDYGGGSFGVGSSLTFGSLDDGFPDLGSLGDGGFSAGSFGGSFGGGNANPEVR